jgi:hypothetical protein
MYLVNYYSPRLVQLVYSIFTTHTTTTAISTEAKGGEETYTRKADDFSKKIPKT